MSKTDFLKGILPGNARYCLRLVEKHRGFTVNKFYDSPEAMAAAIDTTYSSGYDVYYATAGFGAGSKATSENAVAKRELYVDIDCGPGKPYATKADGLSALRAFCKDVGLPKPTVIDSGNGFHAHWIFSTPVPVHDWLVVATNLKQLCKDKGFKVDGACTADTVRVLRVVDTVNQKNAATVTLISPLTHYEFKDLKAAIGSQEPAAAVLAKARALNPAGSMTKSLSGGDPNRYNLFQTIWIKSTNGAGCAQIANAIENADTLPEPVWRGVLSIAQCCEDRDWGIHEISKDHPGYSPDETERKASSTKGPYTCETFQGLDTGSLCSGCPHMGKITSPVQLGAAVHTAPATEPQVVQVESREYDIPVLPAPYVRGKSGGVYIRIPKDDGSEELELVYPHDLYVYKRMREHELGDVAWMRLHMPVDGVREFVIPQRDIGAIDRLRDKLSEQGVTAFHVSQLQKLQAYIAKSIQALQSKVKAVDMHVRFGWTPSNTFIFGDREYTPSGINYAPVTKGLERFVRWFTPKGTLDEWKRVIGMYDNPDMDLHAFGVLAGFGSILMHFSPENGGVLGYYSKLSGTGKTTILRAINSIYGDPRGLMKDAQDTAMSRVHRMGTMNGMPVCVDEMTNAKPEELSLLLYGATNGRARDRMRSGENAERSNDFTWKQITVWSTNAAVADRLGLLKVDPQGELARVLEVNLRTPVPSDVLGAQLTFNALNDNYGHAGHIFLSYVTQNMAAVQQIWDETRDIVYGMRKWTQTERFRLNLVICTLAAGVITNALGLTSFKVKRIGSKIIDEVARAGTELRAGASGAIDSIAAFVNANIRNMLIIDAKARASGIPNAPVAAPTGTLLIRYETDTKDLFISQRDFGRWCAENYINAREIPTMFHDETGATMTVVKKRMGSGWNADFGPVNAIRIQNAKDVLGLGDDFENINASGAAS